jgi:hypothetical protein
MGVLDFAYDQMFGYKELCSENFLHMVKMWFLCGWKDNHKIEDIWISTSTREFVLVFGFGSVIGLFTKAHVWASKIEFGDKL